MRGKHVRRGFVGLMFCAAGVAWAAEINRPEGTDTKQSTRLYTKPDPAAPGGIKGRVEKPTVPLVAAFAIAQFDTARVYQGALTPDGRGFVFKGLPTGKYDLMLVYKNYFYEGVRLTKDENTLTEKDREQIEAIVQRSVPFFNFKKLHRLEGVTGREGVAMAIEQDMRTLPIKLQDATTWTNIRVRSLKVARMECTGPAGWLITNTREVVRQEVVLNRDHWEDLAHHYDARLGNIRVVEQVKDLGAINLKE